MQIQAKPYTNRKDQKKVSVTLDEEAANALVKKDGEAVAALALALSNAGFKGAAKKKTSTKDKAS